MDHDRGGDYYHHQLHLKLDTTSVLSSNGDINNNNIDPNTSPLRHFNHPGEEEEEEEEEEEKYHIQSDEREEEDDDQNHNLHHGMPSPHSPTSPSPLFRIVNNQIQPPWKEEEEKKKKKKNEKNEKNDDDNINNININNISINVDAHPPPPPSIPSFSNPFIRKPTPANLKHLQHHPNHPNHHLTSSPSSSSSSCLSQQLSAHRNAHAQIPSPRQSSFSDGDNDKRNPLPNPAPGQSTTTTTTTTTPTSSFFASPPSNNLIISHPLSAPAVPRLSSPFSPSSNDWFVDRKPNSSSSTKESFLPFSPFSPFSPPSSSFSFPSPSPYRKKRRSTEAGSFLSQFSFKPPDPPKPDDEGQVIFDDWVIGRKIGQGGFSLVKQAVRGLPFPNPNTGHGDGDDDGDGDGDDDDASNSNGKTNHNQEIRAIKIVKRKVDHTSPTTNDLIQLILEHEINIWRHLSHPHIVPLECVHQDDHATWFFMPYLSGGTLLDLMARNRKGIGPRRARRYVKQLVSALVYLHEDVRVVHRDIKPENCLLASMGRGGNQEGRDCNDDDDDDDDLPPLLLSDFGMATWLDTADEEITSAAPYNSLDTTQSTPEAQAQVQEILSRAGTLEYSCPEKLMMADTTAAATATACTPTSTSSFSGSIATAADIWALGAVIYCCIVGTKPFHASLDAQLVEKITRGEWDRAAVRDAWGASAESSTLAEQSAMALELIEACLAVVPEERPSIRTVWEHPWLQMEEQHGRKVGRW